MKLRSGVVRDFAELGDPQGCVDSGVANHGSLPLSSKLASYWEQGL
jgi:hypothetical protein